MTSSHNRTPTTKLHTLIYSKPECHKQHSILITGEDSTQH